MARQCAIVVQRCAHAREGEEEGGVLGQLGKLRSSSTSWETFKDFWNSTQSRVCWAVH